MHIVAQNANQYTKHGRGKTSAAFNDIKDLLEPYGGSIYVNLSMFDKLTYNWQLHVLMHEILHVGLIDHEPQGLMSEEFNVSVDIQACIDAHTVTRWCQETSCDGLQHSTCE